jgi:4-hydroxybutyrate dehydrogenase
MRARRHHQAAGRHRPGVKAAGVLQKALDALPGMPYAVFDQTPSNPTEAAVRAATEIYKAQGCDGLIAVGGGSAIDCAKGVAIAATHEGPLTRYATIEGGSPRITDKVAPLIAVPTTSGTGSEVARGAILIVDDHRKLGFHSWHLVPKTAICDPELTLGLPPKLTAATGMDAIAHCMETFMSAAFNPPADGIALDGLERGWAHIERATRNGSDREARFNLMSASMQGAMAFQKGLGCVHSLSHSLGGVDPRLHHGTLNAMFLPAVVRFNAQAPSVQKDHRLERMAHAMGLQSAGDIPGGDPRHECAPGPAFGAGGDGRGARDGSTEDHRRRAGGPLPQDESARGEPGGLRGDAAGVDVNELPRRRRVQQVGGCGCARNPAYRASTARYKAPTEFHPQRADPASPAIPRTPPPAASSRSAAAVQSRTRPGRSFA